jgi:glyoxylase-like metal-dependent hydrolase (beta-lactamase superfamily II)
LRWNPQLPISEAVRRQVMPEVEADGTLALGLHVAHIQFGDASILVDTGYDDPSPEFARAHPNFSSSPGERAGLASIGVRPEAITHVLFTHPHDDHFVAATIERGGERVPRYPNARYLLGSVDEFPVHSRRRGCIGRRHGGRWGDGAIHQRGAV